MKHYEVWNYHTNEILGRFNTEEEALEFARKLKAEDEKAGKLGTIYSVIITNY